MDGHGLIGVARQADHAETLPKEINQITGKITERRTRMGIPGAMSLLARGEMTTMVIDLEEMDLVRDMDPQVSEATHGGRAQRIATRALVLEDIIKVRGHIILGLDHQSHISPWWDRKGHIVLRIVGTKGRTTLLEVKRQGHTMRQTDRSKDHISQGQTHRHRQRIEDAVLSVESRNVIRTSIKEWDET